VSKRLRLAASVALLGFLAWRTDWRRVADAFAHLRLEAWLLALGVYALAQLLSSMRWQLLARPLGFREPLGRFLSYYYIGMFFNLLLPTSVGGDVVRAWYLDGKSGRRLPAFVSVFADRVSGVTVLLVLTLVAVAVCPLTLPGWLLAASAATAGGLLLALAALFVISRRQIANCELQIANWKMKEQNHKSWRARFANLQFSICNFQFAILPDRRLLLSTTLLSLVVQLANVLVVWLIGLSLGMTVPGSYYLILVPMVTLVTLLPISVNGMGVREAAVIVMLKPLGVDPSTALTLSFLWFAVYAVPSLGGVLFYLLGRFPRFDGSEKGTGPVILGVPSPFPSREVRPDDESVRGDSDQGRARQPGAAA
jgi:uncharacterized protein (TIRG00374 family)